MKELSYFKGVIQMRMWMISPKYLCRQHLLGEHNEIHMLLGCLEKGKSVSGYIEKGLVELHNIRVRHDSIVEEMIKRGYRHHTPIYSTPHPETLSVGKVDLIQSAQELMNRCSGCCLRIESDANLIIGMQLYDYIDGVIQGSVTN